MSEDEVVEGVRALVAAGEYLDRIPGVPEPSMNRGGAYQRTSDGRYRYIYYRWSVEYRQARVAGLVEPLPPLLKASAEAVDEIQAVIGYELPPFLKRMYLEIANGGFGPGYGILGLTGGHQEYEGTALDVYRKAHGVASARWKYGPADQWSFLPANLLPLCTWGCGIWSFVDCSRPEGQMWAYDPNPGPYGQDAIFLLPLTLAEWLDRWMRCKLHQPTLVQDPVTKHWRGATDEELGPLKWFEEPAS